MSSGLSDFGAATFGAVLVGLASPPSGWWIALCTAEPGPAVDGTTLHAVEPDRLTTGYNRQAYGVGSDNWAMVGAYATNTVEIDFDNPGADWGVITHWALCTDYYDGGGDVYGWGELANPQYIVANAPVLIPPGGLVVGVSSLVSSIAV